MNDAELSDELAQQWSAVLQAALPTRTDNFFELGGDSLRAVALIERVEQRLKIELPLEALFLDGSFGAVVDACLDAARNKSDVER